MRYITRLLLIVAVVVAAFAAVSFLGLRVVSETQSIARVTSRLERLSDRKSTRLNSSHYS